MLNEIKLPIPVSALDNLSSVRTMMNTMSLWIALHLCKLKVMANQKEAIDDKSLKGDVTIWWEGRWLSDAAAAASRLGYIHLTASLPISLPQSLFLCQPNVHRMRKNDKHYCCFKHEHRYEKEIADCNQSIIYNLGIRLKAIGHFLNRT